MIPNIELLTQNITEKEYSTKTYKIICRESSLSNDVLNLTLAVDDEEYDRISGYVDGLDAVAQAVYLILSTERYKFIIYSWDYGVELVDLFGKPMPYVRAELPRRIKDALVTDNRIKDVVDVVFKPLGKILGVQFTVVTDAGKIYVALEVEV